MLSEKDQLRAKLDRLSGRNEDQRTEIKRLKELLRAAGVKEWVIGGKNE